MGKIIHLIDRSRVETREECPRKRYLGYDYVETGIEPDEQALPLLSGQAIHSAHARLLAGQPLEQVVTDIIASYTAEIAVRGLANLEVTQDIIREQAALLEGMLRVWAAYRLPRLLDEYEPIQIEETWDWEMSPGLVERIRMDVIARRRDDGLLHIIDFKTMSYPSDAWFELHEHDLQTCLYIQALKEHANEPIGGIVYEGLIKGQFKKDTAKGSPWYGQRIQQSPYTIAYALKGDGLAIYQSEWTNRKGFQKVRTFEEMPMKEWVNSHLIPGGNGMTPVNDLFVVVPATCPPASELLEVKEQVVFEELKYLAAKDEFNKLAKNDARAPQLDAMLMRFAPKRRGACFKYGADNRCKFIGICFNQGAQPLAEGGGYRIRKPHHDTDLEMVA